MALITKLQPSMLFLLLALVANMISSITNATDCVGNGSILVYWGNEDDEGTLKETCDSEIYNIVILYSLMIYDDGSDPVLNLYRHCGSWNQPPCTELQSQIEYCQKEKNIKIFLSIFNDSPAARSSNTQGNKEDVSKKVADYLLKNYLSGQPGPLGSVSLDGIDLEDDPLGPHLKWVDLVKAINASTTERKIYLSASPQCAYPDSFLGEAIKTGLFDYISLELYYPKPCIYSKGDATNLLKEWKKWTSNVPNSLIFLGLAASEEAAKHTGYIPPEDLKSKVLPTAKEASNYGGVKIWDRYDDVKNNYTAQIKDDVPKVCRCRCDTEPVASASVYGRVESI